MSDYLLYCDGACSKNGTTEAKAEYSFAAYDMNGLEYKKGLHNKLKECKPLKHIQRAAVVTDYGTNNLAEATALFSAIAWVIEMGFLTAENNIHICMDSKLILSQFLGIYGVKNKRLKDIYQNTYALLQRESKRQNIDVEKLIHLHWISGEVMKESVIGH